MRASRSASNNQLPPQSGNIASANGEKNVEVISYKSKCVNIALIVVGIASIVILSLGAASLFGTVGSLGFIISVSSGGVLLLTSLIALIIVNCRKSKNHTNSKLLPVATNH